MPERTTELRPLNEKDIQYNYFLLRNTYRFLVDLDGSYFSPEAIFGVAERPLSRQEVPYYNRMWTPKLLDYDPKECSLDTYRAQLIVRDKKDRRILKSIPPEETRRIDFGTGFGKVGKSGYILTDHFYSLGKRKGLKSEGFEEILISADLGQEPADFDNQVEVKVDPALYSPGKELLVIVFQPDLSRTVPLWRKDAVVVDPETRQMVEREVVYPLSYERWGKTQPERKLIPLDLLSLF